jgi:hypothetical protein
MHAMKPLSTAARTSNRDTVTGLGSINVCVKGVHQQGAGRLTLRDGSRVLLHLDDLCYVCVCGT